MSIGEFIKMRRQEIGISLSELSARLALRGHSITRAAIQHWESGRNQPPIEDYEFRLALAISLEIDVNELMIRGGFYMRDQQRTPQARRAADIIDALPEDKRDIAVRVLEALM